MDAKHENKTSGSATGFIGIVVVMLLWFAMSAGLMFMRAAATQRGLEGVQKRLGEVNGQMNPLNFSMRTDAVAVRKVGQGIANPDREIGARRYRIIYRHFLEIRNTAIVSAQVVGIAAPGQAIGA